MSQNETLSRAFVLSVCDKSAITEVSLEYDMPDYEAEVRRLLRVNVTVMPPASYVGSGNASFSGSLRFDILYASPEGKLCMCHVTEGYELSAPIDKDADIDYADEIRAYCDLRPESLISRVTGPRKLSIKCRLRGRIRAYGSLMPSEKMTGDFEPAGIERLAGLAECARFAEASSDFIDLGDIIDCAGASRFIGGEGSVSVSEATVSDGAISCRGELCVRLLLEGENGPYTQGCRLPFSEVIEGEELRRGMDCRVWGRLCELSGETENGKLPLSAVIKLSADAQENLAVSYTRDLYSTAREVEGVYGKLGYPRATVCRMANFTQSLYESLDSLGIPTDAALIDYSASAVVENMICEREKSALVGETKLNLVLLSGDDYKTHELSLPFRYEFDAECGDAECFFSDLVPAGGRVRMENGKLALDLEMGLSFRVCVRDEALLLREARFGAPVAESEECVVCFPAEGETLWDIGKRYRAPMARLRALNRAEGERHYLVVHE